MILREQNICLNVGETAPEFSLPTHNGEQIGLSDYKGQKNVILVLHPGDLSSGCKDHFRFYEQHLSKFEQYNAQVLGVNMASVDSNRDWVDTIGGLGYPILADFNPLGDVTLKYDCFVPRQGYGKRAVFVVDKEGSICYIEVLKATGEACPNMDKIFGVLKDIE